MTLILVTNHSEQDDLTSLLPDAHILTFVVDPNDPKHSEFAYALHWFTQKYAHMRPSLVVLFGGEYQTLAAALAAYFRGIAVVHIAPTDTVYSDTVTQIAAMNFVMTPARAHRAWTLKSVAHKYRTYEEARVYTVSEIHEIADALKLAMASNE